MNQKLNTVIFILFVTVSLAVFSSCKKTAPACDGSNPTYEAGIKEIISANCTSSSCHGSGSSNGDFTSYSGLKPFIDNGKFKTEVLDNQTMPKGAAKLSSSQLGKIACWKDNNYPEK